MKTKTLKILTAIFTMVLVILMGLSTVYAAGIPTPNGIKPNGSVNGINEITDFGGKVMGILQTVGVILAVVILTILGIKYMMGSAEEKAEYKKTMIPYVVGAICIFAAPTIANIIYQFVKSI